MLLGQNFSSRNSRAGIGDVVAITVRVGGADGATKTFEGRTAWAIDNLIRAGESGCTPITHPGPRWSDYVFKAKKGGLNIETVTEPHGGSYRGHHARYVLRDPVIVLRVERAGGEQ